jgi:archaellum component FlaC
LLKAYNELRDRLSKERYGMPFDELEESFKDAKKSANLKNRVEALRRKVEDIKTSYPQIISDAEPTS